MKEITYLFSILLLSFQLSAQKKKVIAIPTVPTSTEIKVPIKPESWTFKEGKVEFLEYKGVEAMKLLPNSGQVVLNNTTFKDGTIEYDVEPLAGSSPSIYFHRQDEKEQEIFYLRARFNKPYANDAVQYAPVIDGVNMWDMFDRYQAPALIKEKEWNHIKLELSGLRLRVFVNDMSHPALDIPRLEGNTKKGGLAFDGESILTNVVIKPNKMDSLPPTEAPDLTNHDANYLRDWTVSLPISLPKGNEPFVENLPKDSVFINQILAERNGLINLTRQFGKSEKRRMVWLKVKLSAKQAHTNLLKLGFSDEVWVFFNKQLAYVDKNLYRNAHIRKTPDGRISIENSSFPLKFKQGENELLIGVANDFYGWGIIARLENLEGIEFVK